MNNKKSLKHRVVLIAMAAIMLLSVFSTGVLASDSKAENPDYSYNYNVYGESIPAPAFFQQSAVWSPGIKNATDIFFLDDQLYIMDGLNGRIIVLDAETGALEKEIKPNALDGKTYSLEDAQGIFVTDKKEIYITLFIQKLILRIDENGNILQVIEEPESSIIAEDFAYNPKRVAVTDVGLVYAVAEGSYQGIVQFDDTGAFKSFFGSNKVTPTLETIVGLFWRKIFSDAQRDRLQKSLPTDYSSIDLGPDGFLYSATAKATDSKNELKKHSPAGSNILRCKDESDVAPGVMLGIGNYGDLETDVQSASTIDTRFTDIAVDQNLNIYGLDTQRGRVFVYDQESNLLGIVGAVGTQEATFRKPISIDVYKDRLYVLDNELNYIFVFALTKYGTQVMQAVDYYTQGLFSDAEPYWLEVRKQNSNLPLCSSGLGRAALEKGEYTKAMQYFKEAKERDGYNDAFMALRNDFLHRYFVLIFLIIAIGLIVLFLLLYRASKKGSYDPHAKQRKKLSPFSVIFHPSAGFDAMKDEKMGSLLYSFIILLALFLVRIIGIQYTGFVFNSYAENSVNVGVEFIQLAALFAAWVCCNWAVGTLIDSEGRVLEIFNASAYALTPYIVCQALSILLSNILTMREGAFVTGVSNLGLYLTIIYMLVAIGKTNRFGIAKTIISVLLTLVGIVFILFLFIMFFSLMGQLVSFIQNIYGEIQFRI